jgi:hypothetical protein
MAARVPITSPETMILPRRFFYRPSDVCCPVAGSLMPNPCANNVPASQAWLTR